MKKLLICFILFYVNVGLAQTDFQKINSYVMQQMSMAKIPGLALIIVHDNKTIYSHGFGYADLTTNQKVSSHTLFELGSTSKAFTGLAILQMIDKNLITIHDPVNKYIPWFSMRYKGRYKKQYINGVVPITIEQLLHQTSGIPFSAIDGIPESNRKDALIKTIMSITGKRLAFYPGTKFLYSTINYDVLGLIIQEITHMSYEQYMRRYVLHPLGLNNTFMSRDSINKFAIAQGYKINFLYSHAFSAPIYRGNTPAGYIMTNALDLAKWIKIQLGEKKLNNSTAQLIAKSHIPNHSVTADENGCSYATGWFICKNGNEILHQGNNPNYSSFIILLPKEKIGVGILANLNSAYTKNIAVGVANLLVGENVPSSGFDANKVIDMFSAVLLLIFSLLILVIMWCLINLCLSTKNLRKANRFTKKIIIGIVILFILNGGLYYLLRFLFCGLSWKVVAVWMPFSFILAIIFLFVILNLVYVYFLLSKIIIKITNTPGKFSR